MRLNGISNAAAIAQSAAPKLAALKKATQSIEGIFMKDLLNVMQKSVHKVQFGDAPGSDIYQDFFNTALADSATKNGSLGLGSMLYRQLAPKVVAEAQAELIQHASAESKKQ